MAKVNIEPLKLKGSPRDLTHSLFKFPGKIHPPLVRSILESSDASVVMDAMSGCGTVAVETARAGLDGIFGDVDPLSITVTKAKIDTTVAGNVKDLVTKLLSQASKNNLDSETLRNRVNQSQYLVPPNVDHWFETPIADDLCRFLISLNEADLQQNELNAVQAVFASSIRILSRADPAPVSCLGVTKPRKKALDEGRVTFDATGTLLRKAQLLDKGLKSLSETMKGSSIRVLEADARNWANVCQENSVRPDLAITSPPYCHAIEYWRRHTLENTWLGLVDPKKRGDHRNKFVGNTGLAATPRHDSLPFECVEIADAVGLENKQAGQALEQYFHDLKTWVQQYYKALASGGEAHLIVGPSTVRGIEVNTPGLVEILAGEQGFEFMSNNTHLYKDTFMQYPTQHGLRVKTESVIHLVKQ